MMQLSAIRLRIASLTELTDVVGAMRALAGMRLQEAQQALPGIRRYAGSVAAALASALPLLPEGDAVSREARRAQGARAVILCTAEHGFVGGFNERMLEAAHRLTIAPQPAPEDRFYVLGSRGAALALERGWRLSWRQSAATRLAGTPASVGQLTSELYAGLARGDFVRIDCLFARYRQGGVPAVECSTLLPLDTAALAAAAAIPAALPEPLHHLAPRQLLEGLAAEYLFARLTEAAVESLASENAARLTAMEAARDNVSHRLGELQRTAQQARQEEITTELLDLIVGVEASSEVPVWRNPG
jgi:F-type H+-transporting ATPase subunit gamma